MEIRDTGFIHPECCDSGTNITIERCYNGNSNFLLVSVPGVASAIVMGKVGLRALLRNDGCNDEGCPPLPVKGTSPSPFASSILLIGTMLYEQETSLHFPMKPRPYKIELNYQTTTVDGNTFNSNTELHSALMAVIADCDCQCGEVEVPCTAVIVGLEAAEVGINLILTGTEGTHVSIDYNYNDGEETGSTDCTEYAEQVNLLDAAMYFSQPNETVFTLNVSNDACETICDSHSFTNYPFEVVIPDEGDDTVFTPTGLPACDGVIEFTAFFNNDSLSGAVLDTETGEITIPAGEIDDNGNIGVYMTCDGVLVASYILTVSNIPLGLRLLFDDIENVPVADAESVSDWNAFFDLPTNGTAFTSVYVSGNEVLLVGGANITIASNLFLSNTNILEVNDDADCVTVLEGSCFYECTSATVFNLPALTEIGGGAFYSCNLVASFDFPLVTIAYTQCFQGCTSATTFDLPQLTSLGSMAMSGCTAATLINIPLCASLGATVGDDNVFSGISGNTITINVPASLATADAGNPDGDLVALAAANTETINYI